MQDIYNTKTHLVLDYFVRLCQRAMLGDMAGKPMRAQLIADIEVMGGEDAIYSRIADGETIADVARALKVSRNFLSQHLNRDDAHRARTRSARETAADALGDEIVSIADAATPGTVNVAKCRIDARRFVAARLNPDAWGEKTAPLIQINANDMHLSALRKIRAEDTSPPALPAPSDLL